MAHMMTQKLWKIIKYFSELPSNKKGAWSKAPFLLYNNVLLNVFQYPNDQIIKIQQMF